MIVPLLANYLLWWYKITYEKANKCKNIKLSTRHTKFLLTRGRCESVNKLLCRRFFIKRPPAAITELLWMYFYKLFQTNQILASFQWPVGTSSSRTNDARSARIIGLVPSSSSAHKEGVVVLVRTHWTHKQMLVDPFLLCYWAWWKPWYYLHTDVWKGWSALSQRGGSALMKLWLASQDVAGWDSHLVSKWAFSFVEELFLETKKSSSHLLQNAYTHRTDVCVHE